MINQNSKVKNTLEPLKYSSNSDVHEYFKPRSFYGSFSHLFGTLPVTTLESSSLTFNGDLLTFNGEQLVF